jgi:hypothetical protein
MNDLGIVERKETMLGVTRLIYYFDKNDGANKIKI